MIFGSSIKLSTGSLGVGAHITHCALRRPTQPHYEGQHGRLTIKRRYEKLTAKDRGNMSHVGSESRETCGCRCRPDKSTNADSRDGSRDTRHQDIQREEGETCRRKSQANVAMQDLTPIFARRHSRRRPHTNPIRQVTIPLRFVVSSKLLQLIRAKPATMLDDEFRDGET